MGSNDSSSVQNFSHAQTMEFFYGFNLNFFNAPVS